METTRLLEISLMTAEEIRSLIRGKVRIIRLGELYYVHGGGKEDNIGGPFLSRSQAVDEMEIMIDDAINVLIKEASNRDVDDFNLKGAILP